MTSICIKHPSVRKFWKSLCLLAGVLSIATTLSAEVATRPTVGSSQSELIAEFGKPKSEMKAGKLRVLVYDGFSVKIVDGVVASCEPIADYATATKGPAAAPVATPATGKAQAVVEVRNNGQQQNIKALLVPNHVTVVDFFADWCGPCKRMDPELRRLARTDEGVVLRKVDIVDWNSPIVQQIGIRFVPYVAVFDGQGQLVGTPSSDINEIKNNVAKAKSATRS